MSMLIVPNANHLVHSASIRVYQPRVNVFQDILRNRTWHVNPAGLSFLVRKRPPRRKKNFKSHSFFSTETVYTSFVYTT